MKERMGAVTRSDAWGIPPEKMHSPRSDPSHPEHAEWLERTSLDNPRTIALIESMRQNGTDEGPPVIVYRDGGQNVIADGDRRQAACLRVNEERRAAKSKLPQLILRTVTTRDPELARQMANACRQDDPPMLLARRFRLAIGAGMEPAAAAAANGLRLDYANALVKCLSLPADLQAKVNAGELPPDVAARAGKNGSDAAREIVAASTGEDGKVDAGKARKAAREATKRPRAVNRDVALAMADRIDRVPAHDIPLTYADVAALVRRLVGDSSQENGRGWMIALMKEAEAAAKSARKGVGKVETSGEEAEVAE